MRLTHGLFVALLAQSHVRPHRRFQSRGLPIAQMDQHGRWEAEVFKKEMEVAEAEGLRGHWQHKKKLLAEVAEHNYMLRDFWRTPRTILVEHASCVDNLRQTNDGIPPVQITDESTAQAMLRFAAQKRNVCGLNFANGAQVGGGYKHGSSAQEEELCRQIPVLYTSLHNAAKQGFYPFGPCTCLSLSKPQRYCDVLYTMGLTLARGGLETGYAVMPDAQQRTVSLVSAAAPNLRKKEGAEVADEALVYGIIESIFLAPHVYDPQVEVLVLGAFGCGAFGNDPRDMANLFVRALREGLGGRFKEVVFAIPPGHNATVFKETFKQLRV